MENSVDIFLVGESLGTGNTVCGGVVNGLSSTVDLWDPSSRMAFIDSSERFRPFSLCLSPVSAILVELFRDLNDGPRRLPSSSWNIEPLLAPL